MTLTITLEKQEKWGALKVFIFKVQDTVKQAITLEISPYLNHISWVGVTDITTAAWVSSTWTDGDETITIGNEFTASDYLKVIVVGS